jgi:hypothetical protein
VSASAGSARAAIASRISASSPSRVDAATPNGPIHAEELAQGAGALAKRIVHAHVELQVAGDGDVAHTGLAQSLRVVLRLRRRAVRVPRTSVASAREAAVGVERPPGQPRR